ncbi:hypothetical protein GDO78_017838, partial [Eleutherodactylus coqui]
IFLVYGQLRNPLLVFCFSKLKCWKRKDVKWLHAVSGEWFEEILKKKFKDSPDVRCLVKPPLTHHLKKTPQAEPESSRMTTSRNSQPQKNSGPSFLGLRTPLSALFSFRKSAKQILKPPPQQERHGIFSISGQLPPNTQVNKKFEIYHSARSVKQIASFFEAQHNRVREDDTTRATSQLEKEVFQVLGDLDQKLAQEQNQKQTLRTSRLTSYKNGRQNAKVESHHDTSEPKKVFSSLSSHDGRRTVALEEAHTSYATYQPRKFYEMYSNRQRPVSKTQISNKSFYKKNPSPVRNTSPNSSPHSGTFSSTSLQLSPPDTDLERTRQHKSKRIPVTAIKWNNAFSSGQSEKTGRTSKTQSALDLTNVGKSSHRSRVFDLYKYKNAPRVPVSTSNDLHEFSNNITSTSGNGSTGYYKNNSPGHGPKVKYSTRSERTLKEESKKNSFKNKEKNKIPSESLSSNDKETESMESESELSIHMDASSVTNQLQEASNELCTFNLQIDDLLTKADLKSNDECKMAIDHEQCRKVETNIHDEEIPTNCTLRPEIKTFHDPDIPAVSSICISEPDIMDVDAPTDNTSSITPVGLGPSAQDDHFPPKTERPSLTFTDHNQSLDDIKKCNTIAPRKSYKIEIPSSPISEDLKSVDQENPAASKRSSLCSNTTDIGGKFAWMYRRRGSNGNRAEVFRSDTLKFHKRNASSLPDLIDEDSETITDNHDVSVLNKSCENVVGCYEIPVPETNWSSRISDNSNEKPINAGSRTFQYLQNPHMSSYGSVRDGTVKNVERKTTYPATLNHGDRLTQKQTNYNHTERFISDTLKYTKRNASSLPDLIDQDSEHDGDYHTSTVFETTSPRTPNERNGMYLDSSTRPFCVQDAIQQAKKSNRVSIKTEKKTISRTVYQEHIMTESDNVKNFLALTKTTPFSQVHTNIKSVNVNNDEYKMQNVSDSNNNTRSIEGLQDSDVIKKDDGSRIGSGYTHQKQDHVKTKQVKSSKCDASSEPSLSGLNQKNVVSSANQKNTNQNLQVKEGCESKKHVYKNLIYQLDQEAKNKAVQYTEPLEVRDSSSFPVSQTVKEHSEGNNLSRAKCLSGTESKSTNLLKQHLLVTPEPFKRNVHINVSPKSEWTHSTISEDSKTPTFPVDENIKNPASENKASPEGVQLPKRYTCQQVITNTEIYESIIDPSNPEVDTIEYRKVVSIYYSLPRKFSRRISDLSMNNLKNIDKTLEQNSAPSALLDKMVNRCHKPKPDPNHQNPEKLLTSITETVHEEVHSVDNAPFKTHLSNFHKIPLHTNQKNGSRPNSGKESDGLVNMFSYTSKNEDHYTAKEDAKNKNEYSPTRSSPRYVPHTYYYTLPSRKSSFQDLERNVLESDIAMARNRFNIYSSNRNMEPSSPKYQDVFTSPMLNYDNLNYSSGYDFMHYQDNNKRDYNINNIFGRDGGVHKQKSLDESLLLKEDLPSIYKAKSVKELSPRKSNEPENISRHMECNTSPPSNYSPVFSKNNETINRARPSYCSEFVQKKMKPINAKKFSYSFDHSGQENVSQRSSGSYGDTARMSDANSPPVLYSPNENCLSYVSKHFGKESPKDCRDDEYLYRSKSMKFLNSKGQENLTDYKRKSDGSFSSKSCGDTLRSKSASGDTWNRRFSAEMLDENENCPVPEDSSEHKPAGTSKSFDYGIFGKEQQEAILNNIKRSLTVGRLWRPSFLKNPGFLRTEQSSKEINPVGQSSGDVPPQGPGFKESLNIYEDEPVDPSDSDTDTTTDDEYYLDDNEKESEL